MASARNSRRKRRRRGRFGILYKLFGAAALAAAMFLGATVFFRVEEVVVSGNARYTAGEIIAVSQVSQGDNLFSLDKYRIRDAILRSLPYIEEVSIHRSLPDKLVLTVRESQAVAWVSGSQGSWLLSGAGKALARAGAEPAGIHLTGLEFQEPVLGEPLAADEEQHTRYESALKLIGALEERGILGKVTYIDLASPYRIVMDFDARFTVKLPVNGDYGYLLRALEAAAATRESYERGVMDLTVENGAALFSPG